jgi:hypothetical protein
MNNVFLKRLGRDFVEFLEVGFAFYCAGVASVVLNFFFLVVFTLFAIYHLQKIQQERNFYKDKYMFFITHP